MSFLRLDYKYYEFCLVYLPLFSLMLSTNHSEGSQLPYHELLSGEVHWVIQDKELILWPTAMRISLKVVHPLLKPSDETIALAQA